MYFAQMVSRDELAAADPFDGRGIRLDFPLAWSRDEAEEKTSALLGDVPHVVWDTHAWADGRSMDRMQSEELRLFWADYLDGSGPATLSAGTGDLSILTLGGVADAQDPR